ncbi:MAG: class I SAM-dependent methyltransferase, partial [Hyphomicrobiales bacterium]|nr:class I SAM-dependent methyltransferase [Hyphomicrobiales bacterium]
GVVVEIGIGTGLNLAHYDPAKVSRVIGVNPPDGLAMLAEKRRPQAGFPVELLAESAEAMSLDSNLADTVVITYTMCSIPDIRSAIEEMRRVLKPGGKLIFCEHGRADTPGLARWQDRLTPAWRWVAGGCHLNRDPGALLETGGFALTTYDRYPISGAPSLVAFHHVGVATPR